MLCHLIDKSSLLSEALKVMLNNTLHDDTSRHELMENIRAQPLSTADIDKKLSSLHHKEMLQTVLAQLSGVQEEDFKHNHLSFTGIGLGGVCLVLLGVMAILGYKMFKRQQGLKLLWQVLRPMRNRPDTPPTPEGELYDNITV